MMTKTNLNTIDNCLALAPVALGNGDSHDELLPAFKCLPDPLNSYVAVKHSPQRVGPVTGLAGEAQVDHVGLGNDIRMGEEVPGQGPIPLDYRHTTSPPAKYSLRAGLPLEGYIRLPQVLAVIPISKSSWWAGVKSGRYPPSTKLGPRTTVWRVDDIRNFLEKSGRQA